MGGFNPQNLGNTAWAFATAGQHDPSVFAALATGAEQRMGGFSPQELANTAWAFAMAGQHDTLVFAALATGMLVVNMTTYAQGICNFNTNVVIVLKEDTSLMFVKVNVINVQFLIH